MPAITTCPRGAKNEEEKIKLLSIDNRPRFIRSVVRRSPGIDCSVPALLIPSLSLSPPLPGLPCLSVGLSLFLKISIDFAVVWCKQGFIQIQSRDTMQASKRTLWLVLFPFAWIRLRSLSPPPPFFPPPYLPPPPFLPTLSLSLKTTVPILLLSVWFKKNYSKRKYRHHASFTSTQTSLVAYTRLSMFFLSFLVYLLPCLSIQ